MQAVFYNRDFSGKLKLPVGVSVVRYSWHMQGGPLRATLTAPVGADHWELMKLLRCPVEVYGANKATPLWWGYVNRVVVPQGEQRFGRALDGMYNHITVRYAQDGLTEAGTNAVSISEYGQKELVLRSFDLTGLEAAQLRGTELEDKQNPKTEIEFASSNKIEIECLGWYETLRWKHYTNATESNVSNTTQIETIVGDIGQFIGGVLTHDASGVVSNQARDARDGLSCVNELLQAGTSNYRPLLARVDHNRYLHVWERSAEPPAGAVDYVMRDDGRLETVAGGALVPDEYCTVAKWVQAKGSPLDFAFFIESAEYNVAQDKTTYRPAGAYEQRRLAKYIADVVTGDGPHVWPSLIPPNVDENDFQPFWVALGKEGDTITAIRGVDWDSTNNVLYVTGQFTVIGGVEATNFAKLDMATGQWYALNTSGAPGATNYGWATAVLGTKVYFGTQGAGVGCFWEYDTSSDTWTDLSSGTSGPVNDIAIDGTDVYIGGAFTSMPSSTDSKAISKWNGSSFSALGTGLAYSPGSGVQCLSIAIGGGVLYAVGKFDSAGGTAALNVAAWDGVSWSALGTGLGAVGNTMDSAAYYNSMIHVSAVTGLTGVFQWDGTQWVTIGDKNTQDLTVSDDGSVMYAIGAFSDMNGVTCGNSTYWDGANWYPMNIGLAGATVTNGAIAMFDSAHPVAVGNFTTADGKPAKGIAMYITTLQGLIDHLANTGGVARPGGPDQAVQYNYDGRFGGSKYLKYDYTNKNIIFGGLDVPGTWSNTFHQILEGSSAHVLWAYGTSVNPYIAGIRARGTVASPSAVQLDDVLFIMRGRGQYGTSATNVSASRAYMQFVANENWDVSNQGARIELYATPAGSTTPSKVLDISPDALTFGGATNATGAELETLTDGSVTALHKHNYFVPFGVFTAINPLTVAGTPYAATIDRNMALVNYSITVSITAPNSGSAYWTITLARTTDGATIKSFDTSGYSAGTYDLYTTASFDISSLSASDKGIYITAAKTGSPGGLYLFGPLLEVS